MAITKLVLECDHCSEVADGYEEEREATQDGWFIVKGADWLLGGDEKIFCSFECLRDWANS